MLDVSPPTLQLTMPAEALTRFFPLLRRGVWIEVETGNSLQQLLVDQLGIGQEFIDRRITTIFLNSKVVDNLDAAFISPDATLALSSAVPGLVGATMQRGGFYATMRGAVTRSPERRPTSGACGRIRVKLFNLLMHDLGDLLLARGIILPTTEATELQGISLPPQKLQQEGMGQAGELRLQILFDVSTCE
ncbi:hypothetical protein BMS3Abin14_01015 [bacterium BMS3Abin14]|nr:hypothetical protein BMS3Abin14_01015 [bacterium BMS3Abin14]